MKKLAMAAGATILCVVATAFIVDIRGVPHPNPTHEAFANLKYSHDHNCEFVQHFPKPEPIEAVMDGEKKLIGGDIMDFDSYDCGGGLRVFVDCYEGLCKH